MKKSFLFALILSVFALNAFDCEAANKSQKVFNKLNKQEQMRVLRGMKRQEMAQINSQIKDVKSQIKLIETNADLPLNKSQEKLLNLNRELTLLTDRKAELEKKYKLKMNEVKNK